MARAACGGFRDGQLYVDLRGAGSTPAESGAVLGSFLRAFGVPDEDVPTGVEERAALYRSVLEGRRVLIVLDNARDAAQIRPLLPGTVGCTVLVTSRARLVDLAGARLIDLDVMSVEEAMALFTRISGAERVVAEQDVATFVVRACGLLPLAIRIAASRLAARPGWSVADLAGRLADSRRRIGELQVGDLVVTATFEVSYDQLEADQARAFRVLGLPDGPDISLPAAAALLGLEFHLAEDLLESLVDVGLLETHAPGRYRYHDLVRLYARSCVERDEPPLAREAAFSQLLDFYLASAATVYAMAARGERLVDHLDASWHSGLTFTCLTAALNWLRTEGDCLIACAQQAAVAPATFRRGADLLLAAWDLVESKAHAGQSQSAAMLLRDAAQTAGDPHAEGRARIALSHALVQAGGRLDEADREERATEDLSKVTNDPLARCYAPKLRGITAYLQGRYHDADTYLVRALEALRADGNVNSEVHVLGVLAGTNAALGRTQRALDYARQGTALLNDHDRPFHASNGRYTLAVAYKRLGHPQEALHYLTEALAIYHRSRRTLWVGLTHLCLAELHLDAHRPAQAASHAEQALETGIAGGPRNRRHALTLLASALNELGQTDRATACLRDAENLPE